MTREVESAVAALGGGDDEDRGAERHERHRAQTGRLVPNLAIEPDERAGQHRRAEAQEHVEGIRASHAPS